MTSAQDPSIQMRKGLVLVDMVHGKITNPEMCSNRDLTTGGNKRDLKTEGKIEKP